MFEQQIETPYPRRMQVSLGSIIDVSLCSEALQDHAISIGQKDHAAGRMQNILHRGQHFCFRAYNLCIELIPIIVSLAFILMNMSQV